MTKQYVTNNYEIINIDKIQSVSIRYYIRELEDTAKEPLKHFKIDFYVSFKLDNSQNIEEHFNYYSKIETLRTSDDKISIFNDEYKKYTKEQKENYDEIKKLAEIKKIELAFEIKRILLNPKENYLPNEYNNYIIPSIYEDILNIKEYDNKENKEDDLREIIDDEFLE